MTYRISNLRPTAAGRPDSVRLESKAHILGDEARDFEQV
jgi:hypothetical protein